MPDRRSWPAARVAGKLAAQARLLWRDPEAFARNLQQFTQPHAFEARLLDMPAIPALRVQAQPGLAPTLNVLLPAIAPQGMTGGPNTVLAIGARLAHGGVPVRFIACDRPPEVTSDWLWSHLAQLTGLPGRPPGATLDGGSAPLRIGEDDLFLASFWTTAHQAAAALPQTRAPAFLYLIQDFEPGFYPWSSRYALALATYDLPFRAIVNEAMLADFLFDQRIGRFADPSFRAAVTTFEPAVDRSVFRPPHAAPSVGRKRRLLVYSRPTNPRNLLGMAVAALQAAVAHPAFAGEWEFLALGARGSLRDIALGGGRMLREAPWRDYTGYAGLLQTSDILLCPMLSPHTSYPVLEMAACGGIAVTNSFASKTAARLAALSPHIVAAEPTVESFAASLIAAADQVAAGAEHTGTLALPTDWSQSLAGVHDLVRDLLAAAR